MKPEEIEEFGLPDRTSSIEFSYDWQTGLSTATVVVVGKCYKKAINAEIADMLRDATRKKETA